MIERIEESLGLVLKGGEKGKNSFENTFPNNKRPNEHILPPQKQYPPLKPHRQPNHRNNRRGQR